MYLTILIPCLNEENSIGICIEKAKKFMKKNNIDGEVLIADNGSTDKSIEIARNLGARVTNVKPKGYGNALRYGTKEAKGKYVIMGDADDSYNFLELEGFIEKLEQGYDFVIGNRYTGNMQKGAMKPLHRFLGTPVIAMLVQLVYKTDRYDVNCGLRAYNNEKVINCNCKAEGMEYASEMVIKAKENNLKMCEIPINFCKDQRGRKSYLRTIPDGIRNLKVIFKMY